ncbi:MAG: TIGR03032 family protein [Pirellulales bacterium]
MLANSSPAPAQPQKKPWIECRARGNFLAWMERSGGTVVTTTYNSGKLALISCVEGQLHLQVHKFARPMGLALEHDRLALATQTSIVWFDRVVTETVGQNAHDATFVMSDENVTGKLNVHDIAFAGNQLVFANTKYNCIARPSTTHHFARGWQPLFISDLSAGDRCHLNGVGVRNGRPRVVTAFCQTNAQKGWREEDRFTGGIMIDMQSQEVIARGLCMPHSPRWYRGHWWLCNSGQGTLCRLDPASGKAEEICALPGFSRGLWFVGNYALVGLSRFRKAHVLDPTPVAGRLKRAKSGIAVVNVKRGRLVGVLEFVRGGREVYDVSFLPDIQRLCLAETRGICHN